MQGICKEVNIYNICSLVMYKYSFYILSFMNYLEMKKALTKGGTSIIQIMTDQQGPIAM